jgi:hypothetical protein
MEKLKLNPDVVSTIISNKGMFDNNVKLIGGGKVTILLLWSMSVNFQYKFCYGGREIQKTPILVCEIFERFLIKLSRNSFS